MSRIWMAILVLVTTAACASSEAAKDGAQSETPGATETREATSEWQLRYFGTTAPTQQAFECAFAAVPNDRVGYICSTPGIEDPSFLPLSPSASNEIVSAYKSVDWDAEVEQAGEESAGVSSTRFVLKRPGESLEVTRTGAMSNELRELEDTLLSSVREVQDEMRSGTSAQREDDTGVCFGACEDDEWCEQVECFTSAPGPGPAGATSKDSVRWNGPTNMCEEVGAFPVCQPLADAGDSCERHEQCASQRCEGIISPVCVSKS